MARLASKRNLHCKCGKNLTIKSATIYCPGCGKKMEEDGFRFLDHLKIVNLRRTENSTYYDPETELTSPYWVFNLSIGGILINGFTYNPVKRSAKAPTGRSRTVRVVKMLGHVARHIQGLLDAAIAVVEKSEREEPRAA